MRSRPKARLALAGLIACSQLSLVAFAGAPPVGIAGVQTQPRDGWSCSISTGLGTSLRDKCKLTPAASPADETPQTQLPTGTEQCPNSGPQVTCHSVTPARLAPGVASVPVGNALCPIDPVKAGPTTPASCNDTVLPEVESSSTRSRFGTDNLPVRPSVPASTLSVASAQPRVSLSSSDRSLQPGQSALLTATSGDSVSGTPFAIEIFDETTGTLLGACMQSSQCLVAYTAKSGAHTLVAFITQPTAHQPSNAVASSSPVTVSWLGVTLVTASASVVAPGKPVTLTATATADFVQAGYVLALYDQASGARLTYCSQGTTCSTTLTRSIAGRRSIVAYLGTSSESLPLPAIQAQSAPITVTWLGVSLAANTVYPRGGGAVYMKATANADVTKTPWSIGIYDEAGNLVSDACKTGATCSASVQIPAGKLPWFTAVVGATATQPAGEGSTALTQLVKVAQSHAPLTDIQARSAAVQPTKLLWGVDSCKPIVSAATAGASLYGQVVRYYGHPDFWGRYMTTTYNCPGLSSAEIAVAARDHFGILPIYNDYDCSAVRTYKVGSQYAGEATTAAANLGIPQGRVVAIDIEPYGEQCPGAARVDAGFVEGWYDGVMIAGYIPLFYGNGTAGSEFGNAWCRAVKERPEVAIDSFLWTFQPSLIGRWTKAKAPAFTPNTPGCAGNFDVWQYVLSTGARPDVDSDEALSTVPFWIPQASQ